MTLFFSSSTLSLYVIGDALIEPGEDPEVIRAKYFIRDEFLVNGQFLFISYILFFLNLLYTHKLYFN